MAFGMQYVAFNDQDEVFDLDLNTWKTNKNAIKEGAAGRRMYKSEPRHPAYYTCFGGRDPETHYIIGVEREHHPDHSSRFGYAKCWNGYCSGQWPGRYATSALCSEHDPQPLNQAPNRFYTPKHQGENNDLTQAVVDYEYWKNYGINLSAWWGKYEHH